MPDVVIAILGFGGFALSVFLYFTYVYHNYHTSKGFCNLTILGVISSLLLIIWFVFYLYQPSVVLGSEEHRISVVTFPDGLKQQVCYLGTEKSINITKTYHLWVPEDTVVKLDHRQHWYVGIMSIPSFCPSYYLILNSGEVIDVPSSQD